MRDNAAFINYSNLSSNHNKIKVVIVLSTTVHVKQDLHDAFLLITSILRKATSFLVSFFTSTLGANKKKHRKAC